MNKRFGDRRLTPRFDIVGELWGTLEAIVRFQVDNIGPGGVLFYSHVALPPDSVHQLTVSGGQREFTTQVQVRHVRPATGVSGEPAFAIGVEFLGMHPVLVEEIRRWSSAGSESFEA